MFWQFTIKTLGELDIVSNQNLSIEMFLIRLIHLKEINSIPEKMREESKLNYQGDIKSEKITNEDNELFDLKSKTIGQIKNVVQEKQLDQEPKMSKNLKNMGILMPRHTSGLGFIWACGWAFWCPGTRFGTRARVWARGRAVWCPGARV